MNLSLSQSEIELMRLYIVDGLTVKEISVRLAITERSIEKRIEYLRKRMACSNVRQLIYKLTNSNIFESKQLDQAAQIVGKTEAAHILGVSERTIERLVASGKIRSMKVGRYLKLSLADVQGLSATG
jgi:excisionase family DNA binding protein